MRCRRKLWLQFAFIIGFIYCIAWFRSIEDTFSKVDDSYQMLKNNFDFRVDCDEHEGKCSFLVNGKGCSIPSYKPFHKTALKFMKPANVTCNKKSYAFVDGRTLRINKTLLALDYQFLPDQIICAIDSINRAVDNDKEIIIKTVLYNFQDNYESQDEFLKVTCREKSSLLYEDFFLFVHLKQEVEQKNEIADKQHALGSNNSEIGREDNLSILMVGLDSMSHLNFLRRMPLSYKYLKDNMSAIELQGYTKLADNTFPCLLPLLTGKSFVELNRSSGPYDYFPLIWKKFSEKGYRTLFAEDATHISMFNHEKKGFRKQPTDYYLRPLCLSADSSEMRQGDENKQCFNSRLEVGVVFEWVRDFIRLFRLKLYFAFIFLTGLFHGLLNEPQKADPYLYKLLSKANDEGLLNNTVVMVFGDHGLRGTDFQATRIGKYEERLPLFLIVFPKWFPNKYPGLHKNLQINQHRLTTLYDVHELLKDLLNFKKMLKSDFSLPSRGISLFRQIPLERSCKDAAIAPHWCMCNKYYKVSVNINIVKTSANILVEKINSLTEQERYYCSVLQLHNILSAEMYAADDEWFFIRVTFETIPGMGRFEGTAKFNNLTNGHWATPDFSRINKYGSQSDCIHNSSLSIFCYCGRF